MGPRPSHSQWVALSAYRELDEVRVWLDEVRVWLDSDSIRSQDTVVSIVRTL